MGTLLDSYPVETKVHREGIEYSFHLVEDVPPPDDEIPFLLSECLFNMRSALDQLVYQLHVRRFRGNVPPAAERASMFPILDAAEAARLGRDPAKWNGVKRLGARERTAIKQFQPYLRRNKNLKHQRDLLDLLAKLNNIDKHRRLHVAKGIPRAVSQHERFPGSGLRQTVFYRPLIAGTEVEHWTFAKPTAEVPMNHQVWVQVVIDEPTLHLRTYINPAFGQMHGAVENVLRRFAALFPQDEPYWRRERPAWLA
jgi:hypothetical protein